MKSFSDSHAVMSFQLLASLWKDHSEDIWNNWKANLFADLLLSPEFKKKMLFLFRDLFKVIDASCDHLSRNNIEDFYKEITDKWIVVNQFALDPHLITKGIALLEKSIVPFLSYTDSYDLTEIAKCFQSMTRRLVYIINEISKSNLSNKQFEDNEYISETRTRILISFLNALLVEQVSIAEMSGDGHSLTIIEKWERRGKDLQKVRDDSVHGSLLLVDNYKKTNIYYLPVQDGLVLVVIGKEGFGNQDLRRLHDVISLLNEWSLNRRQLALLNEKIVSLELLNGLDLRLIRYSGIEGLVNVIDYCRKNLKFKRCLFFRYCYWTKTVDGILGINVDQKKIQSIREPLNNLPPFKDAYDTKKPVYLKDSYGKIPDIYVKTFNLTSILIVPIFNDKTVYGWLVMDQQGEKFEVSKEMIEFYRIIGIHIGAFLERNDEPTRSVDDVKLTEREVDILQLLAEGYENNQIGDILNISGHTARDYVSNLMIKLNAKNRAQLVAEAFRRGLLK